MRSVCAPFPPLFRLFKAGGSGDWQDPQHIDATHTYLMFDVITCVMTRGEVISISAATVGEVSPCQGRCSPSRPEPPRTCRAGVTSVGASVRLCGVYLTRHSYSYHFHSVEHATLHRDPLLRHAHHKGNPIASLYATRFPLCDNNT